MNIKKLSLKVAFNVFVLFVIALVIIYVPRFDKKLNTSTKGQMLNESQIVIENGMIYVDNKLIDQPDESSYVFNDQDYYEAFKLALTECIDNVNEVNVKGDEATYLSYLQSLPKIIVVYSDAYRISSGGLDDSTIYIESLNKILGLNMTLVPVSAYTEDKGMASVKELVENGTADLGFFAEYKYQKFTGFQDDDYKISKAFSIRKLYALSIGDDTVVDLNSDKIAFVDSIKDLDVEVLNNPNVIVTSREKAVEMLYNYEVDHIVEANSEMMSYYADNGLYMNILDESDFSGLSYVVGKKDYAKALVSLSDRVLTSSSIQSIVDFANLKFNFITVNYLNTTKDLAGYKAVADGYIDVAYSEHKGLIANDPMHRVDGYTVDVLKYLSKSLGVKFRLHDYSDKTSIEISNALNEGEIDMVADAVKPTSVNDIYNVESSVSTLPYLTNVFDVLKKVDSDSISSIYGLAYNKVGILKNDEAGIIVFLKYKLRNISNVDLRVYNSYAELEKALKSGEIKYAVTYSGYAKSLKDRGELWCVDAFSENQNQSNNTNDFYFQLRYDDENMVKLATLINRGLASINTSQLLIKWFYIGSIYDSVISEDNTHRTLNITILIIVAIIIIAAIGSLLQQDRVDKYLNNILLVDEKTGFGNNHAYDLAIDTEGKLYHIMLKLSNYRHISYNLEKEELDILSSIIATRIKDYHATDNPDAQFFRFTEDGFSILLPYDEELNINIYLDELLELLGPVYVVLDKQVEVKIQIVALLNELINFDNTKLLTYSTSIIDSHVTSDQNYSLVVSRGMIQRLKKVELVDELLNSDLDEIVVPYYKPIYSLKERKIIGLEVIGRIATKDLMLSNLEYEAHADESGILGEIDSILFRKMLLDREQLIKQGLIDEKTIFSLRACEDSLINYEAITANTLKINNIIDVSFIQIQLPEHVLAKASLNDRIKSLQTYKVKLVVDDFNVGHSSLSKMLSLKLDGVKIAHHNFDAVDLGMENSIFESLQKMINNIDVEVTITDIQNTTDFYYIGSNKVDYMQGDYFMRAVPFEFVKLYLKNNDVQNLTI